MVKYVIYDKEQLFSHKPSIRAAHFVRRYLDLTKRGAARIDFSRDDLKKWLFPLSLNKNGNLLVGLVLNQYDKAKKL